jgi:hypothetical protein
MVTVIFGAGASYDSIPYKPASQKQVGYPNRPPLANELFDFRFGAALNNYRACRPLAFRLRQLGSVPLEDELDRLMQEAAGSGGQGKDHGDARLRRQLAAVRFYLQEVVADVTREWPRDFAGITNYSILADRMEKWSAANNEPVLWVNFNYDTLLEEGLDDVIRFRPRRVEDYVRHDRHKVVKPHGSVNWAHPITDPDPNVGYGGSGSWLSDQMIDRIDQISIADEIRVTPPGHFADPVDNRGLFPAMTIPVRQKSAFECPSEHVDVMRAGLTHTKLLLVVGWAGNEQNFLQLCRENLPRGQYRIHIVSGDEPGATSTAHTLEASLVKGELSTSQDGFTGFLSDGTLEELLSRPPLKPT